MTFKHSIQFNSRTFNSEIAVDTENCFYSIYQFPVKY